MDAHRQTSGPFKLHTNHRTGYILTHTCTHTRKTSGLKLFDLTKDGVEDIIVGRDDGRLDVYGQDTGMNKKTSLLFSKDIGKSCDRPIYVYPQTLVMIFV